MKDPLEIMEESLEASKSASYSAQRAEISVNELVKQQKTITSTISEVDTALKGYKSLLEQSKQKNLNQSLLSLKIGCAGLILVVLFVIFSPSVNCFFAHGGQLIFQNDIFYCAYR